MANVTSVPAIHRDIASEIPEDIRERLTAGELRMRCAHAAELRQRSSVKPAEQYRYLQSHSVKVLRSMPVAEWVAESKRLSDKAANAGGDVRRAYYDLLLKHKEEHSFPPGIVDAIDRICRGDWISDPTLAETAAACIRAARSS